MLFLLQSFNKNTIFKTVLNSSFVLINSLSLIIHHNLYLTEELDKISSLNIKPPGLPDKPFNNHNQSNQQPSSHPNQPSNQTSVQNSSQNCNQACKVDERAEKVYFIVKASKTKLLSISENRNIWPATSHTEVISKYLMVRVEFSRLFVH